MTDINSKEISTIKNENEDKNYRISQLENALVELLVETKKYLSDGRINRAWSNANLILNTK